MDKLFIVVEGIADQVLLVDLLSTTYEGEYKISYRKKSKASDTENLRVVFESEEKGSKEITFLKAKTNGKSIQKNKIDEIRTPTSNLEHKTVFILDADAPNFTETSKSLIESFKQEGLDLAEESVFLLPDNKSDGCLEDLLIQMVSDKAKPIFRCFESYKECIHGVNPDYTKPDIKTKVYAYSEIITKSGNERNRDYTNREVWNIEHESLAPLVKFLKTHLS
ncbi:MAG: DUF3226 domain-containing protein [Marinoscillum sp.]